MMHVQNIGIGLVCVAKELLMDAITIGYMRADGDLAVVCTLQNFDQEMPKEAFRLLVEKTLKYIQSHHEKGCDILAFERDDTPSYITL